MRSSSTGVISITAPQVELKSIEAEKRKLSKEDAESVNREVYGGAETVVEETPELVRASLAALETELCTSQSMSVAYKRALSLCEEYVSSAEFRLMFLRAEKFRVEEAAGRIFNYWESRLLLFGEDLAFVPRPIHQSDLSERDLATLRNNGFQFLPRRDKSGRGLILSTRQKWLFEHQKDIGRLFWYLFEVALQDEVIQKKGFVCILHDDGPFRIKEHYNRKLDKLCIDLITKALPVRIVGMHHCYESRVVDVILPFLLFLLGRDIRLRYKNYEKGKGTNYRFDRFAECGITPEMLPTWIGGTLEFDPEQWLETRQQIEQGF